MMVPTFITSWYGMNVDVPLVKYGAITWWIISGICLLSVLATHFILGLYEKKYPRTDKRKKIVTLKRKERKNAKRMKSIEAALSE